MDHNKRREFIKQGFGAFVALPFLGESYLNFAADNVKTVLIRTGWDHTNSSAIANIPAMYRLIQKYVPNTKAILWPYDMDDATLAFINKSFTNVNIVNGQIDEQNQPTTDELKAAFEEADLFIYSPGLERNINWSGKKNDGLETSSIRAIRNFKMPYLIFGIGEIPEPGDEYDAFFNLCESAALVFVTDSKAEGILKDRKIKLSKAKTIPHSLISYELSNDTAARDIFKELNLIETDFITVNFDSSGLEKAKIDTYLEKIRYMIKTWLYETGNPVLFIGMNEGDLTLINSAIIKTMTENEQANIKVYSKSIYPDVELSIYDKPRIVTGMMTGPAIYAIQSKTPIYYFIDWSQGTDGQNSLDFGLKDYVINMDECTKEELANGLLKINKNYVKALLDSSKARDTAYKKMELGMMDVDRIVNKTSKQKEKKSKN